jgi:hypothetical protein
VLKTVQRLCAIRQGRTPEAPQRHPVYGEETLLALRALDSAIRVAAAFQVAMKTALDLHCWPLVDAALADILHSGADHELNQAVNRDMWECDNEALAAGEGGEREGLLQQEGGDWNLVGAEHGQSRR